MSRWLVAVVVLVGALAVGGLAFLNGGTPVAIRLTTSRAVTLPLGTALGIAFGAGAALIALLALGVAAGRAWRAWRTRRSGERTAARLARERTAAETLLASGETDAARARLAEAVTAHGADERLLELLAGAAERSGDVAGAIAAVEEARRRTPRSPLLARRLVSLYATAGRWEDALALETEALLELRSPAALADEAALLSGLRYEAALADPDRPRGLRRLAALTREHPEFVPAWVALGDRLRETGRLFRARRAYERGARVRPAAILLDRLAAIHAESGRPDRARSAVARVCARHPDDQEGLVYLAGAYLRDGALADAEAILARWPPDRESPPAIEALRGELCRRSGASEEALLHFARAAAEHLAPARAQRCRACGAGATSWAARCVRCGRWDTIGPVDDVRGDAPSASLISPGSGSTDPNHCADESTV
jgi:tetratricopeptide (TPR) repeat protein